MLGLTLEPASYNVGSIKSDSQYVSYGATVTIVPDAHPCDCHYKRLAAAASNPFPLIEWPLTDRTAALSSCSGHRMASKAAFNLRTFENHGATT